jgi:hypothetical protein
MWMWGWQHWFVQLLGGSVPVPCCSQAAVARGMLICARRQPDSSRFHQRPGRPRQVLKAEISFWHLLSSYFSNTAECWLLEWVQNKELGRMRHVAVMVQFRALPWHLIIGDS